MSPLCLRTLVVLSLSLLAHSPWVQAQSEPDVGGTNRPLWEAGVAGFALSGPAYPGASDNVSRALVLPWIIYRGPILRADGGTVGARLVKTRDVEFDIGFAGALSARSQDVAVRQGMPDLGFLVEFGPRVRFNLARPSPDSLVRLDVPLRAVFELKDGLTHRGFAFEPRLAYDKRDIGAGWGLTADASLNFGDGKFNEYLYGVPTQFATATRNAYQAQAGLITPRLQVTVSHRISQDVRFFGFTRFDFAGAGVNSDSPLHLKDRGASVGVGLVWTLGRSSAKAVD
ncbi:MAG: MipA/OmpV family protein [Burkholderiales bacterium]